MSEANRTTYLTSDPRQNAEFSQSQLLDAKRRMIAAYEEMRAAERFLRLSIEADEHAQMVLRMSQGGAA